MTGLYVITDTNHLDVARAAAGRAAFLQIRDKEATSRELFDAASEMRNITRNTGTHFIVNDRADIVLASGADGVHLGADDLPLPAARDLMGKKLVGASVDTVEEAREAARYSDYVSIGPIFPTGSKPDAGPVVGLETVSKVKGAVNVPVVAIGGIDHTTAAAVAEAGADHVAVLSAIRNDPEESITRILKTLR